MQAFLPLVQNAALLLGAAVLSVTVTPLRPKVHQVIMGLGVGVLGVCLILTAWVHASGYIFDTRSILLGISGLYLGLVPTIIAMAAMILMRVGYGGSGAGVGVATILVSGLIGIIWRHFRRQRLANLSWAEVYAMGVIIEVLMLLLMLGFGWPTIIAVIQQIALPRLLIFPIGTAALGVMITSHLRRSEESRLLKQSEEEIRATLYGIGDGVISANASGHITRLNQAAERLTGWTEAQAKGKSLHEVFKIINEGSRRPVANPADRVLLEGVVVGLANHTLLIARDGTERPIADSAAPIFGDEGQIAGVVLVFSNQEATRSARKALEESELRFRVLFEQAATGVAEVDAKTGRHLRVNAKYCGITRYTDEEMLNLSFVQFLHADDYVAAKNMSLQIISGEIRESAAEARFIRSDGSVRWVSGVVAALWAEGEEPTRMVLTLQDVTEQKVAQQALKESSRRLATLMNNLPGMAYRCVNERSWAMEFVSMGATDLTGYQHEDLLKGGTRSYGDLILLEDRNGVWDAVQAAIGQRSQFHITYQLRTADGAVKWVDERGMGVFSDSGELVALEGFVTDITEQTHAQIALNEAERFATSTIDALSSHLCVLDEQGNILATNSAWRRFAAANLPTPTNVSVGANYLQVCDAVEGADRADAAAFALGIRAMLRGELAEYVQEYPCHSPQEKRWFAARVTRFPGSGPVRVVVNHINITERKSAERAFAESEARFRAVVEGIPEAIFIRAEERFAYVNPAAIRLFGATEASELVGELIIDHVFPESRGRVIARMRQRHGSLERVSVEEEKILRLDGSVIDVEVSARPFRYGQTDGAMVFARDVTLRKLAERELDRAADFTFSLMQRAPALIWRASADKKCDWFNETWLSFTGRTREQEVGDGWAEGVHAEDRARRLAIYTDAFDARQQFSMEYRLRRADGVYRWILDCGIPYDDLDGQFSGYIGYCFDVSELKQAHEALRGMAEELSLIEERERRRLAEHLHDEVCQILSLAQIKLAMSRQHVDEHLQLCATAEELVIRANRSLRSLLMEMSHPALYELGFSEGAEWLIEDMDRLYGLRVHLEDDKSFSGMDVPIRVALFQSLRELLTNVAKHGGVSEAVVRLHTHDGKACVEVQDNGRGFVVERLEKHTSEGGFGLFAIRERLRNIGGLMKIRSKPGEGVVVFLSVLPHTKKHELCESSAG